MKKIVCITGSYTRKPGSDLKPTYGKHLLGHQEYRTTTRLVQPSVLHLGYVVFVDFDVKGTLFTHVRTNGSYEVGVRGLTVV